MQAQTNQACKNFDFYKGEVQLLGDPNHKIFGLTLDDGDESWVRELAPRKDCFRSLER